MKTTSSNYFIFFEENVLINLSIKFIMGLEVIRINFRYQPVTIETVYCSEANIINTFVPRMYYLKFAYVSRVSMYLKFRILLQIVICSYTEKGWRMYRVLTSCMEYNFAYSIKTFYFKFYFFLICKIFKNLFWNMQWTLSRTPKRRNACRQKDQEWLWIRFKMTRHGTTECLKTLALFSEIMVQLKFIRTCKMIKHTSNNQLHYSNNQ